MPTLRELQGAVDAWIEPRLASVASLQASRLAADGRYWQGLWTHDEPPADGAMVAPNIDRAAPGRGSYRAVGAAALFPGSTRARVSIDEYAGPQGRGYVVRAQFRFLGTVWERCWATGPHADGWPEGWHEWSDTPDPPEV